MKNKKDKPSKRKQKIDSVFDLAKIREEHRQVKAMLSEIVAMQTQIIQNAFRIHSLLNNGKDPQALSEWER